MPNIRQTTIKDGETVLLCEFHTNPPPSTGQKRKEANQTALLPAQPPSKTPKPSPTNQPNLVGQNFSKLDSVVQDVEGNLKVAEKSKGANVVEEKEKAVLCCVENCSKTATIWPFNNSGRASRRLVGYCDKCNVARKKELSSKKNEVRRNMSANNARRVLFGWAQEAQICFQECNDLPYYTKDQVKLGFFSRDFLKEFVTAGRMMVGKESTVASAKATENGKQLLLRSNQAISIQGCIILPKMNWKKVGRQTWV